ncbi:MULTISPECIES: hypothetical protein [unclassified Ensifer]|uniref:hypothetical protein n=1 Tax=unclassified Ensifer TaxID=2633371 RepID=UPI000813177F|nr:MULTISPECIES: hypothetical protein [unclassified Ensifer]OCP17458.1 hypothetical protein BC361_08355 [Ensifer sp. LC54]OCP28636.1 hypothetical protein BC363_02000 [Ensifer sp. LC384]
MTIVDLQQVKDQREGPDADCLLRDHLGRPMGLFGFEYVVDGRKWSFHLEAYSHDDAEKHIETIRQGVTFLGQLSRTGSY